MPDEIAQLEAQLEHASAIAACSIGQPDRAERIADREHARKKLEGRTTRLDATLLRQQVVTFETMAVERPWRIHDPRNYPNHWYVFTNENDARTALLALNWAGHNWELDPSEREVSAEGRHMKRPDVVVREADRLRREHYESQGVAYLLPWDRLTDAQKVHWILKAAT